ncbi:hypothetical protein KKH16_01365, partial [Patescibacteria group bacterium]|nr:hypothetical protein [Patescibacteria group bacterium]
MTKNLDGIKKITLKNFNKSNKIFSDVSSERKIFTKVDARNIIKLDNTKIRKVDGITERKMFSKHKEEQFKKLQKAKEAEYRYQEERIRLEKEEKLKEEKEAERRYQEEKLQKAKEERIRLEKKRQEKLLKKALKQKRRIALIKKIRICSKKALKNSLILLLFFAIFYIIFCVIVLKFSADNSLTRKINKHLFVPALIFDMGLINYYDYKDELIKNEQLRKDIVEKKLLKK